MKNPCLRFCLLLLWLGSLMVWPAPTHAGQDLPSAPTVRAADGGVEVTWRNPQARSGEAPAWRSWSPVDVNGLALPASLIPLRLDQGDAFALHFEELTFRTAAARSHEFAPVELPVRTLPSGEEAPPLSRADAPTLPDAPVILLREGQMRGERIGVLAVLPLYQVDGEVREVVDLHVSVAGASPWNVRSVRSADEPWRLTDAAPSPSALTSGPALKVMVTQAGIQEIPIAEVIAAGLAARADLARLQLSLHDQPIALEIDAAADRIRFYAPPPGDRWNQRDTYWLTLAAEPSLRMENRPASSVAGDGLPQRQSAWERGEWYRPAQYVSQYAGPDGDHWFMADLRAGPDLPPIYMNATAPLGLPPVGTTTAFTLTGTAYVGQQHTLRIHTQGIDSVQQITSTLSAEADWTRSITLPADTHTLTASLQSTLPDAVRIDRLSWLRPVSLAFGGAGGYFESGPTAARLQLRGLPADVQLYDITDPWSPLLIDGTVADGQLRLDSAPHRRYLVAPRYAALLYLPAISGGQGGSSTGAMGALRLDRMHLRHRPQIDAHTPADWQAALAADLLYIAPAAFVDGISPLIAHRQRQGYAAVAVDVQQIYDGWSGGQVSPQAIRAFLRYAAANGKGAPVAVTLIGDGTSDPWNYTRQNNINFMPPYLVDVDPWLGETACEVCYAQLDGDDPLDDALPDLRIGRIPAKSVAELDAYVEKLLAYETTGPAFPASARALYVADNYRQADGSVDSAGDFAAAAEKSIALQPSGLMVERLFYDPFADQSSAPGRISDAVVARHKTIDALSAGAGFVTYVGHAHFWQWAQTDLNVKPPYLLGVADVDLLTNRTSPAVVLEMTCLTAAFQTPAESGATVDERLIMHGQGGAVAVWGSSGLGVGYGHDALQRGFFIHYWGNSADKRMGALVEAGQLTLFTQSGCCQETLHTFILLGDPMMPPRVEPGLPIYLPQVGR